MSTRALIYGGIQIGGIVTRVSATYDGISIEHRGTTTKTDGRYESAAATVEMSPHEALDLALCLIRAVERHGIESQRSAAALIKRLAKQKSKSAMLAAAPESSPPAGKPRHGP